MKQINLLNTKAVVQKQRQVITLLRKGVVVVGTIVLLSVSAVLYLTQAQQAQRKSLDERKKTALITRAQLADLQTQAHLVESKVQLIQKLVDKEPRYRSYLESLSQLLPISTQEAELVSASVDNQKVSQVQLSFTSEDTMQSFLQKLEQSDTQKRFKKISVSELNVQNKALSKGSTLELELEWNE